MQTDATRVQERAQRLRGRCAFEVVARRCLFLALCSDSRRLHQLLGAGASGRVFSSVGSRPKNWGSESNEGVPHELELLALASMRPPGRGLRPDPASRNGDGRFAGRDLGRQPDARRGSVPSVRQDLDGERAAPADAGPRQADRPRRLERHAGQLPRLRRGLLGGAAPDRAPERALRRPPALHGADVLVPQRELEGLLGVVARAGDRDLPLRERALVLLNRTEPGPSGSGETASPRGLTPRSSGRARPVRRPDSQGNPGAHR